MRTVVVRSCMKNAPLWMERKCETYRQKLSRSPVMTKPAVCCRSRPVSLTWVGLGLGLGLALALTRSRPVSLTRLPVAKK